jgi:hypothetical protein
MLRAAIFTRVSTATKSKQGDTVNFIQNLEVQEHPSGSDRVAPKVLELLSWISAAREPESAPARKRAPGRIALPVV